MNSSEAMSIRIATDQVSTAAEPHAWQTAWYGADEAPDTSRVWLTRLL